VVLLFDLDGTLIDSRALVTQASIETLRRGAGVTVPAEEIEKTLSWTVTDRFHKFAPGRAHDLIALYNSLYTANVTLARPFPGVLEMLAALRDRGVACAVVTSRRRATASPALRTHHLRPFFRAVVCEEDVASPKPAPDPVLTAAALLGASPGDAVMIGDSVLDIQSGRAAGARTGAALWGSSERDALLAAGPDYALETPGAVVAKVTGGT
jgi:HAD superfamily hydrolase (TIGR01509 family)